MEKKYSNGEVTIIWKPDLCIHSANCVRGLPGVFNNKARPWINEKGAETDAIIEQVRKCPSAALSFSMNAVEDEQVVAEPAVETAKVKITPLKNGPLKLEGKLEMYNEQGEEMAVKEKVFLCRCGHSSNKPFCDGSHKKVDFQAD